MGDGIGRTFWLFVGTKKLSPVAAQIVGKLLIEKLWVVTFNAFFEITFFIGAACKSPF